MRLEQGVAEFLASLAVERGLADATIRAYRRDLADYLSFLDGRSPDRDLIDGFVADLHGRGWVATTVGRVLFNSILPRGLVAELGYRDEVMKKKALIVFADGGVPLCVV